MNEIEQLALKIRRHALEVLDGKESLNAFLESLWQMDSKTPSLLKDVATQLEYDNGRWSNISSLPEIKVARDQAGNVGLITFTSLDSAKNNPIVWCSNRSGLPG